MATSRSSRALPVADERDDRELTRSESKTAILTLDFECDYGTILPANYYRSVRMTPALVDVLEAFDVPLSCFVQTEILEREPEAIDAFDDASVPIDFHAHSHTHTRSRNADTRYEVKTSVDRLRGRYADKPIGYRFPDGDVPEDGYDVLSEVGVPFSASLFPTWRPGYFDNSSEPTEPHRPKRDLVEIPFTPYSDRIRLPMSLSYFKLFGRPFQEFAFRRPPDYVVFDFHMHDLVTPRTYRQLPPHYRTVYARNRDVGFRTLGEFISSLQDRGYEFETISSLFERITDR